MRTVCLLTLGMSLLRVCGRDPPPPTVSPSTPTTTTTMVPEHGGTIAVSAGLTAEVVSQPDGRLVVYVQNPQRDPVIAHDVQLWILMPDGQRQAVAVTYDPSLRAYVGRATELPPGNYPVEVQVHMTAGAPAMELITPPVRVTAVQVPAPRHGGHVQLVGDYAVETVVARNGDVALFWMDLEGRPIPATEIEAPTVDVTVAGQVHTVPTRVVNDAMVAHVDVAPTTAAVSVAVPAVVVRGVRYRHVRWRRVAVVSALPVVSPAPAVVVQTPVPAAVVVTPTLKLRHGHGHGHVRRRGRGHWPGVFVVTPRLGHEDD